jgi:PRC-barrel domain
MTYVGKTLYTFSGKQIGKVTDVLCRSVDLEPEWVAVKSGLLGREHLVPAAAITERDGALMTQVDDYVVKHAPVLREHVTPTGAERERLRAHFGIRD